MNLDQVPVVEACAADRVLVDLEAQGPDQVQRRLGGAAGSGDGTGVRWDLRLDQDHVERARHRVRAELRALGHERSYDTG